ncbi:LysR family transcriptional regulator [Ferrimonas aestuarii]|uniref:LysR family transcriptional regulator n=1 Tax=Ferrimonas aestuarii TaxID=2569539 RepID=A0A4U1BSJ7_9GAMM|nr:LysR family transcriptional regulator [Ferrimonas aestuarii]TKB55021.1 LysR family transcriptional regulator [Ferrimonas aestuarii]
MNLEHLRLFVRLAATHNISAAGQELGLSPAVASTHINKLEAALGVRLVHRTTRKVSLTEEGLTFLPHAQEVLAQVEVARASIGVGNIMPKGTLRVSAPASFATMHMMPKLKGFLGRYPELTVDFRLTDTVVDLVEGGFDIAIRNSALKDSSLIARKLARDKRMLCASPEYLAKHGTPRSLEELAQHNCIVLTGIDTWQFQNDAEVVTIRPRGSFRTDNGTAMRQACVAGVGIAMQATWNVHQHLRSGELVPVLEDYPLASDVAVWAVYPSSQLLAPKVRAFIDYYIEQFGTPPYWDSSPHV